MKKRILPLFIALVLLFTTSTTAAAVEMRSSPTLAIYSAKITQGSIGTGKLIISYDVRANTEADEVGVASIEIYKAGGTYVTTITGTTRNGLIATNTERHRSSYTYTGITGTEYYAVVTATATIGEKTDSKDYTTNTETAP